jgi:hypothetical protein
MKIEVSYGQLLEIVHSLRMRATDYTDHPLLAAQASKLRELADNLLEQGEAVPVDARE